MAGRAGYRAAQFLRYLMPAGGQQRVDDAIRVRLTPAEWALVRRLARGDRRHLLAVRLQLERAGTDDADLLKAALLHDIGKADGRARVRLVDRVALVLLGALAPGLLVRLTAQPARRWGHGLYLAAAHAEVGALLAARAGCSERVCQLIRHHHDAAPDDPALCALQAADEGT